MYYDTKKLALLEHEKDNIISSFVSLTRPANASLLADIRRQYLYDNVFRKCETLCPAITKMADYSDISVRERNAYASFIENATRTPCDLPSYFEVFHLEVRNELRLVLSELPSFESFMCTHFAYAKKKSFMQRHFSDLLPFKYGVDDLIGREHSWGLFNLWCRVNNCQHIFENNRKVILKDDDIHGKLSFVPKDYRSFRSVITIGNIDMFVQLLIGQYLELALTRFGINLTYQPLINRALAAYASERGHLATVDLSAASDRIYTDLVASYLDGLPIYDHMCKTRVLQCEYKASISKSQKEVISLNMFGTMGNGFTFPLQTLLFAAVSRCAIRRSGFKAYPATYKPTYVGISEDMLYHSNKSSDIPIGMDVSISNLELANYTVFGDDIIIPTDTVAFVTSYLEQCDMKVNVNKTFKSSDPFRESCGSDYWLGHDIRFFSCKRLENLSDVYILLNRAIAWSAKYQDMWLYDWIISVIQFLSSRGDLYEVPLWFPEESGLRVNYKVTFGGARHTFIGTSTISYSVHFNTSRAQNHLFNIKLACDGWFNRSSVKVLSPTKSHRAFRKESIKIAMKTKIGLKRHVSNSIPVWDVVPSGCSLNDTIHLIGALQGLSYLYELPM